jgi:hypothetical protein
MYASTVAAGVVGVVRFRRLEIGTRILAVLCIVAPMQLTLSFVMSRLGIRNYEVLNNYRPFELLLIGAVLYGLSVHAVVRRIVAVGVTLFLALWIVDLNTLDDPTQINNRMAMLSRIIVIVMTLPALYFGQRATSGLFSQSPLFWVGTAALLYSSGSLFVVGFSNQLAAGSRETFISAWHINWSLLIMNNLFYMKGLLCKPRPRT